MKKRLIGGMSAVLVLALVGLCATAADILPDLRDPAAAEGRLRRDVSYLASDALEGRGVNTQGINLAADYIAAEFKKADLKPGGAANSFFQPFSMRGPSKKTGPGRLLFCGPNGQTIALEADKQFTVVGLSGTGKVSAPVVFAGYGAVAKRLAYDDFKDVDVADKVVVLLRKTPRGDNKPAPFDAELNLQHAGLNAKLGHARSRRAAAVLFVNDHTLAGDKDPLMDFTYTAMSREVGPLPVLQVRREVVDRLLASSLKTTLRQLEQDIDRDLKPHSARLTGWTAELETSVQKTTLTVKNVIGVAEGTGPLARETVVVGAHYDHLGFGGPGSLAVNAGRSIYHGADDNASGTTAVLELARHFGLQHPRKGRRIVFIAFTAEESGLLGSSHYCANPVFPLPDTVAMVNLDMVGRLRLDEEKKTDRLIVAGSGTAKSFDGFLDALGRKHSLSLRKQPSGYGPSDHNSFYHRKIPVIFFCTGVHSDYHKPTDMAEKINIPGMRKIVDLAQETVLHLATEGERPLYVSVPPPVMRVLGGGPRLGIMPDYGDAGEGLRIAGVAEGGLAAKSGMHEGDRIVEIGGKPVKGLEGYMGLMRGYKKGDTIDVGIVRATKKTVIKVKVE